jgi:hypothetical protein
MSEALGHVALAQGRYDDVLSKFDATLIENVKHWRELGASASDIAVILDQPQARSN